MSRPDHHFTFLMNRLFSKGVWNPHIAGILSILSVVISTGTLGKPKDLGASTTFVSGAGLIEKQIVPEHIAANEYFNAKKVKVDWQMMFVAGIFFGAAVYAEIYPLMQKTIVPLGNYGKITIPEVL